MTAKTISTKPNLRKRIYSGLTDYAVIFVFIGILLYLFGETDEDGDYGLQGLPAFAAMLFWFVWIVGAEQFFGGTLGNRLQKLKVLSIRDDNVDLTFGQSFKRHLVDMFDLWPFGILGILFIKNTKYNQRLGDLWAKTIVVDSTDSEQGFNKELTTENQPLTWVAVAQPLHKKRLTKIKPAFTGRFLLLVCKDV